jgi:cell division transport system permease protein
MSMFYIIREGYSGFKRTPLATFTAVIALTVSIILIGILARFYYSAYEIGTTIRNDIDMEVFLEDVNDQRLRAIRSELTAIPIVGEVSYISKDSAAAVFRDLFGAEGTSLADLNFLPASFRIKPVQNVEVDTLAYYVAQIERIRGVDEVSFNLDLLKIIDQRLDTVLLVGAGIGGLILITALILVFNTIRLTIYAKRPIIRAMKLVGATNSFIRSPFLMEGVLQGLIASVLGIGVIWLFFNRLIPFFIPQFGVLPWPGGRWYYLILGLVLLSVVMGYIGSRWAARKFIRDSNIS